MTAAQDPIQILAVTPIGSGGIHRDHVKITRLPKARSDAQASRDVLLATAVEALKCLFGSADFDAAVADALRMVGEAANLHRVKVILARPPRENEAPAHELTYEWWAPSLASQASFGVAYFPDHLIVDEYLVSLRAGRSVFQFIDQVTPALRASFELVGMRSMGIVPIFIGSAYAGMVAFDDCVERRVFSSGEMDALAITGRAIGAAIYRREMQDRDAQQAADLRAANAALTSALATIEAKTAAAARAVAEERARMAGEIHDSLAQAFTSIALQSEAVLSTLDEDSPAREPVALIEETARLGLAEARSSVLALRPVGEAPGDLENALTELASRCSISGATAVRFKAAKRPLRLGSDARDGMLRVAQEAVTNALRHARASRVDIELRVSDRRAMLRVTDDGGGMPGPARDNSSGFGLRGMQARAAAAGGTIAFGPGPGGTGTSVHLEIPIDLSPGAPG